MGSMQAYFKNKITQAATQPTPRSLPRPSTHAYDASAVVMVGATTHQFLLARAQGYMCAILAPIIVFCAWIPSGSICLYG